MRSHADTLDTLAAIWILACNDENAAISYAGLTHRLRLPAHFDVRELVASRGELFRLGVPAGRLTKLKERYRGGKKLPSWLRAIPEGSARDSAIDALRPSDFFRSQFRTPAQAPPSPIEILNWGLQHIDRLRKASLDVREEKTKRWSLIWIPLASTAVTLVAITCSAYLQREGGQDQRELKQYEVSFRPKADGYASFLQALSRSFENALTGNRDSARIALNNAELGFIQLEPYLTTSDYARLRAAYEGLITFVRRTAETRPASGTANDSTVRRFATDRDRLRTDLYEALFSQDSPNGR